MQSSGWKQYVIKSLKENIYHNLPVIFYNSSILTLTEKQPIILILILWIDLTLFYDFKWLIYKSNFEMENNIVEWCSSHQHGIYWIKFLISECWLMWT